MATFSNKQDNLEKLSVKDLKKILKDRKVSSTGYKKAELLELARESIRLYQPLEEDDREGSLKHRTTVNGVRLPGPDSTVILVTDDLKGLPSITLTDLLIYLRVVCKWGDERLRNYKEDEGYKMYYDGTHITNAQLGLLAEGSANLYVKAKCVPEQSQSALPYKLWLLLQKETGAVESAGCECVASDDGTCKHVVALLFSTVDFSMRHLDRHTLVGTDVRCKWNQARRESKPVPVSQLDLRRKKDKPLLEPTPLQYIPLRRKEPKDIIDSQVYKLLKEHAPNAALLSVMKLPPDAVEAGSLQTINDMVIQYKELHGVSTINDLPVFVNFLKNAFTADILEKVSALPQGSDEWLAQRDGRITGSIMGKVWSLQMSNQLDNYFVRDFFNPKDLSDVPAINYGKDFEPVARTLYIEEKQKEKHKGLKLKETGLIVDESMPIIGASPDGILSCACCLESVVEIKCSFAHQNVSPRTVAEKGTYHVYIDSNGQYRLKESSSWYHQMITEMGVTGCTVGNLVLFTNKGIIHFPVPFSQEHWVALKEKCGKVYEKFILPKL